MKKIVKQGEIMPRGYGTSYIEWFSGNNICHPIPLNIIIALCRKLKFFLSKYHGLYKSWYDDYLYTISQVEEVYCEITGNQMSYHNYPARSVISMFEEYNLSKSITQDDVKMFIERNDTLEGLREDLNKYFDLHKTRKLLINGKEVCGNVEIE